MRDENCLIAQGKVWDAPRVSGGHQLTFGNKANAIFAATNSSKPQEINPVPVWLHDETQAAVNPGAVELSTNHLFFQDKASFRGWHYGNGIFENVSGVDATMTGLPGASKGYICGHIHSTGTGTDTLFRLRTELPEEGTSFDFRKIEGDIIRDTNGVTFRLRMQLQDVYEGWTDAPTWDLSPQTCTLATSIPNTAAEDLHIFVFWSWARKPIAGGPSEVDQINDYNDTLMGIIVQRFNGETSMNSYRADQFNYFQDMPLEVQLHSHGDIASGLWYVNVGEFIDDPQEIISLYNFGTHFESPASVIGWRSETSSRRVVNKNVTWEAYELRNEKRPGKIRWSLGGAVPELYERNIFQEIKRIIPLKSWQPTDEHNTLLIWTKDKVLRMALSGDNREASALITEMHGVGLQNPDELAQVTEGVIWKDGNAVYLLNANSLKEIARQVVDLADETMTALYDKKNKEVLFIPADGNAYCYNLKWGAWSRLDYGLDAKQFIEYDGKWCLVADGVYDLDPTDDTKLAPLIRTKKHPARMKLRRLTIHGSGGTVKGIIHNHRLAAGYTTTPEYTFSGDDPKAMPQLSGDYVQFEIVTDTIHTYDIEAAD